MSDVTMEELNAAVERLNALLAELAQAGYTVKGQIVTPIRSGRPELELAVSLDFRVLDPRPIIGAPFSPDVWKP